MAIFEYGEYSNVYDHPDNLVDIFEQSVAKYANNSLIGEKDSAGIYQWVTYGHHLHIACFLGRTARLSGRSARNYGDSVHLFCCRLSLQNTIILKYLRQKCTIGTDAEELRQDHRTDRAVRDQQAPRLLA